MTLTNNDKQNELNQLEGFLVDDGWSLLYSVGKLNIYSKGDSAELTIPKDSTHPEFDDLMNDALDSLAELYNTDEADILNRIYVTAKNNKTVAA